MGETLLYLESSVTSFSFIVNINYNYDLLDEFFVNSKDSLYLVEYINSIHQVNQEKIVNEDNSFILK